MPPKLSVISGLEARSSALHPHQLLLAEFIHRSANDFAVVYAEINLARREATRGDVLCERLEIASERLLALAAIQRLLLAPKGGTMDLGGKLCELCCHYATARFAAQSAFVRVRAAEVVIDSERGWTMLMIVSELLTNVARHAFLSPGGLVSIDLTNVEEEIYCSVSDTGIGMPSARRPSGIGQAIITGLARDAAIQYEFIRGPTGTTAALRLPMTR